MASFLRRWFAVTRNTCCLKKMVSYGGRFWDLGTQARFALQQTSSPKTNLALFIPKIPATPRNEPKKQLTLAFITKNQLLICFRLLWDHVPREIFGAGHTANHLILSTSLFLLFFPPAPAKHTLKDQKIALLFRVHKLVEEKLNCVLMERGF